jgi:membrane protease YdiL (CAAX protease family)
MATTRQMKTKSHWQTARLAEFLVLFVLLPLVVYFDFPARLPKIPVLALLTLLCGGILLLDRSFPARPFCSRAGQRGFFRSLLWRVPVVSLAILAMTWWLLPEGLFAFPRNRPRLWLLVMLLYPILSAWPQELIYRTFFFHRYRLLFATPVAMIAASALGFAYLHIIFDNWVAVLLSLPAGLLFAHTYHRTGSLHAASIEHAIYGDIAFTVGLGRFFYEG